MKTDVYVLKLPTGEQVDIKDEVFEEDLVDLNKVKLKKLEEENQKLNGEFNKVKEQLKT